jgi:aminotransferase in exopolysaccharide biosynthesis
VIPLSIPHISGKEWAYVKECLDTGWVSSVGKFVDRFENEMARYTGANHTVACASGTAALHIALMLVGVRSDDEVIVPTVAFIAPINAVNYVGAHPVFMDCDEYYNLDVSKLEEFFLRETELIGSETRNKRTGRRIAAIIPVHVFGNAVRMDALLPLCKARDIPVVEDAAESLGTVYNSGEFANRHAGTLGDIGCLSFNGNKIITTGGGGMLLTNDAKYAERAKYLTTQAKDDDTRFIHNNVGYNYRLTNVQAAIGVAQLEQMDHNLAVKKRNFEDYQQRLKPISGLHLAEPPPYARNNLWMYALQIDRNKYGADREGLMASLGAQGIQTRPVWYLNHLQQPFRHCQSYRIERATDLWDKTLNLPCSVGLSANDVERVVDCLGRRVPQTAADVRS